MNAMGEGIPVAMSGYDAIERLKVMANEGEVRRKSAYNVEYVRIKPFVISPSMLFPTNQPGSECLLWIDPRPGILDKGQTGVLSTLFKRRE